MVVHACNPSYLGGCEWEDGSWKLAWPNSSRDPIAKINRAKWTGGVAHEVERLLCKHKVLSSLQRKKKKLA
jgi:hypothetical protein